MKRGLVVGEIWATRKARGLDGRQLKLVVEYPQYPEQPAQADSRADGRTSPPALATLGLAPLVVAVDTLDVRCGQEVLLAYGSGARNVLVPGPDNRYELCDAAVALLIDPEPEPEPDPDPDPKSRPEPLQAAAPAEGAPRSAAGDDRAPATPVAKRGS